MHLLFCLETVQSIQNAPTPPRVVHDISQYLLVKCMVNYSSNKKNSKVCNLGSIFNRVYIQHVGVIKNEKKKCICKAVEKWPRVYFQRLSVLIFNGGKAPEVQYSTLKNEPRVNFQPGSKYFVTTAGTKP
jgi:hypothetical protein